VILGRCGPVASEGGGESCVKEDVNRHTQASKGRNPRSKTGKGGGFLFVKEEGGRKLKKNLKKVCSLAEKKTASPRWQSRLRRQERDETILQAKGILDGDCNEGNHVEGRGHRGK